MKDNMQSNLRWSELLFQKEFKILSKEEDKPKRAALASIKVEQEINQKHTKPKSQTEHIKKKIEKMENGGSTSKSKAELKKERDAWMKENIIITHHKWSEDEEKKLQEKFGSLGIKEEPRAEDDKEKDKNMFLWDSESDDEDDYYVSPEGNIHPIHTLYIKYSGFGDIGDFEEILTLEGGRIIDRQVPEKEEDDAHPKREPSIP